LKGRFRLIDNSRLTDPKFAEEVFMVCAALHNYLERAGVAINKPENQLPPHVPTTIPQCPPWTSDTSWSSAAQLRTVISQARLHRFENFVIKVFRVMSILHP
jgi:hypothetical protein